MSDGIALTIVLELKPEAVDSFCAKLPTMLKDTAQRPGYRSVKIFRHKEQPNRVIFFEEWDSEEDYKNYLAWRASQGSSGLDQIATAPPKLDYWPTVVAYPPY